MAQQEYLVTHARLEEVALKKLGEMSVGGPSYAYFKRQADQIALEHGIRYGKLMLAMTFNPGMSPIGVAEIVYPIADFEWDAFVGDISTYASCNPTVWVVDGDKFTAPI